MSHLQFTGVFYEISCHFKTISRLRSHPVQFQVEGKTNYRPLAQSTQMTRSNRKMILEGGKLALTCSLKNSGYIAGQLLEFSVSFENSSKKTVREVKLTIKQQVAIRKANGKRITVSRRVGYFAFNDCANAGASWKHDYAVRLPKSLPSTQSTRYGLISIEYHVNCRLDLSFKRDLHVRLPILVLQRSMFPAPDDPPMPTSSPSPSSSSSSSAPATPTVTTTSDDSMRLALPTRGSGRGGSGELNRLSPRNSGRGDVSPRSLSPRLSGRGDVSPRSLSPRLSGRKEGDDLYQQPAGWTAYELAVACFRQFDTDKNGEIDREEFSGVHRMLIENELSPNPHEELSWTECDADGDGKISFNELVDWLKSTDKLPPSPRVSSKDSSFQMEPYPYVMTEQERLQVFGPAWTHGEDVGSDVRQIGVSLFEDVAPNESWNSDDFPSSPRLNSRRPLPVRPNKNND